MSLKVLCLDVEGGYGGSSRSLYESLAAIDPTQIRANVWCARKGPIQEKYQEIGIPAVVMNGMPRHSALPRLSRNLWALWKHAIDWQRASEFFARLEQAAKQYDLVHLNHEALHSVAVWLRRKNPSLPITMHIRTMTNPGLVASWQARRISRSCNGLVFISENERDRFHTHLGGPSEIQERVIYNIARPTPAVAPHRRVPRDGRLVVACLSNYAWVRGVDRIVEVAQALRQLNRRDILFVVAGKMDLPRSLPGVLGDVARAGGDLGVYAEKMGVADMILFLGHVADPEAVLAASDVLIKPTRENNPWGRDILEALTMGVPVVSIGSYDRFVRNGVTGFLQDSFDAPGMARMIATLADDRAAIARMGEAAQKHVGHLCDAAARGADLQAFWNEMIGHARG